MRRQYYVIRDEKKVRVPGVTTVLGELGWGTGGLMFWANKAGLEGKTLEEAREKATTVGTRVHELIECDLLGRSPSFCDWLTEEQETHVSSAMAAYRDWSASVSMMPLDSELELVSDDLMVGGRVDLIARVSGRKSVVDWKTSNRIYEKDLCQVAAYANIYNETHSDDPVTDCHILRVGKDDGSFHHHHWSIEALDPAFSAFLHCLSLRSIRPLMKGMI